MDRTIRLAAAVILLTATAAAQAPTLSVVSAYDGNSGPFIRTEVLTVTISEPALAGRPCTLFTGTPLGTPLVNPGPFQGSLAIDPGTVTPFGPYDGLNAFGMGPGGIALALDATGTATFNVLIPVDFGAPGPLPISLVIQGAVGMPVNGSGQYAVFTNPFTIAVDEPQTSPVVTGLSTPVIQEGTSPTLIISGTGLLERATGTLPEVTFLSTSMPGNESPALSVALIDSDPGPAVVPALQVTAPPKVGSAPAPPMTAAGLTLIRIDFSNTGLYNAGSPAAMTTTNPTPGNFGDPTYLVYQTGFVPSFAAMAPQAGLVGGGCNVTIDGGGFLIGSTIVIDPGGPSETLVTPSSFATTQLGFTTPPLPSQLFGVVVRNPDHHPTSPRETSLGAPATDFAVFPSGTSANVAVTGINPPGIVEGSGGGTVFISGTCPTVGGYTALDVRSGATRVNLGSNLDGTDAAVPLNVISVQTPAPGQFVIEALVPDVPPGLNPPGLTEGGLGNAGVKHAQIVPPFCLEPAATPHLAFSAIPGTEPGNAFAYFTQEAPQIVSIAPNNAGRVDGGQSFTISGSGFFTNDDVLPSSNLALMGASAFGGTITETAFASVTIIDDETLVLTTPDLTALGLTLPMQVDTIIRNPDAQQTSNLPVDDFWIVPSLSGTTAAGFATGPGTLVLDTGTVGAPTNVFTFTSDVTLDAALLLQAFGAGPLIIRCRGDVTIDGVLDLSGDVFQAAPGPSPATGAPPAGGGARGRGGDMDLAQNPTGGLPGSGTIDALLLAPFNAFGFGGIHSPVQGGGGGGGGMLLNGGMGLGMDGGPTGGGGGPALGFANLPFAILGAGDGTESFYPPGGSGGGAGGLGFAPPYTPGPPAASIGLSGSGGNGGGAIYIAADGSITFNGTIRVDGEEGFPGALDMNTSTQPGGGGGGGSGGAIAFQAIQGIIVNATATATANGGSGGAGGLVGVNGGGGGSVGMIRFSLPSMATATPQINGAATISPAADVTGW